MSGEAKPTEGLWHPSGCRECEVAYANGSWNGDHRGRIATVRPHGYDADSWIEVSIVQHHGRSEPQMVRVDLRSDAYEPPATEQIYLSPGEALVLAERLADAGETIRSGLMR